MTTRDKILEKMYSLSHDLEADWTETLEDLNIYEDVAFIYNAPGVEGDTRIGNTLLCFTVLAYDNKSKYLDPHKDRWENKKKILVSLDGLSAMTKEIYVFTLVNKHREAYMLADWYIKYQKDWRWDTIISNQEYHSMAQNMANKGAIDAQEAIQIGKMLEMSEARRRAADTLSNELRTEFLSLDTALQKEGRPPISDIDTFNFMSFEVYLGAKNQAQSQ
jgi:hypothetical protein